MPTGHNPIIPSDFPDPDIIRVGDTYYMASTTMYFMPGCDILRSFDLVNWELLCHAYDTLEDTPGHRLAGCSHIYGQGMWAPSLRYHEGSFYLSFSANDTHTTYLLTATDPAGPWEKLTIRGFYHDGSLLFDDDGRVYIAYGHRQLYLTELAPDLSGPMKGGLHRLLISDAGDADLGYEGTHLYKKDGLYYLFTCHMAAGARKTEDCFISSSLAGDFSGRCIIDDDMGYRDLGVAQGGMVDTPDGHWYLFMFQDRGAVGRSPVLLPMVFDGEGFPTLPDGRVPLKVSAGSTHPAHSYAPLNGDDDFLYAPDECGKIRLKPFWQFNHNPAAGLWSVTDRPGAYRIYSGKVCHSLALAQNTLTQRACAPESTAWVTVDGSGLGNDDYAGICALIGCYGAVAITREAGKYYLVMLSRPADNVSVGADPNYLEPAVEYGRIPMPSPLVTLKVHAVFSDVCDTALFSYRDHGDWRSIGIPQPLYFKLDHFTGCRFGLFLFSTRATGGYADFMRFRYWN